MKKRRRIVYYDTPSFSFYLIPVKFTLTPSNVPFKKFPANHTFSKYEMSLGP